MDSDGADSAAGELELPMSADTQNGVAPHFPYAVVGAHMANYDFMIKSERRPEIIIKIVSGFVCNFAP